MRKPFSATVALISACLMAVPASAAPLAGAVSKGLAPQAQLGDQLLLVQLQGPIGPIGGAPPPRGAPPRGGPRGHRGGYHGGDGGAVAAGVLGGLLFGAIIASEAQRSRGVEYCIRRYRSYDPDSMTYLGRDGRRHRCP